MSIAATLRPFIRVFSRTGSHAPDVRAAAREFHKRRLDYYDRLADLMEDTDGRTTLLDVFTRDAQRYAGTPRGILAAYWAIRYHETGANLAETWQGTLPEDDVALIAVASQRGMAAVIVALRDLKRVGAVVDESRREFATTIAVSLIGVVIAFAMLMGVGFGFEPFLKKSFNFVPPENYGPLTRKYFALGDLVRAMWWLVLAGAAGAGGWLTWALPRWTGGRRGWCDDHVLLFKLYRDFKGALFLATFASLTKGREGATTGQRDALLMIQTRSQPWLAWKIAQMVRRIDDRGALDASTLDVGVVDREVFYMVSDIYEARGISEGLEVAGRQSEKRAAATIASRAKVLRAVLLGGSVLTVITLVIWQNAVFFEFKRAIQMGLQ